MYRQKQCSYVEKCVSTTKSGYKAIYRQKQCSYVEKCVSTTFIVKMHNKTL